MASLAQLYYEVGISPDLKKLNELEERLASLQRSAKSIKIGVEFEYGGFSRLFSTVQDEAAKSGAIAGQRFSDAMRNASRGHLHNVEFIDKNENVAAKRLLDTMERINRVATEAGNKDNKKLLVTSMFDDINNLEMYYKRIKQEAEAMLNASGGKTPRFMQNYLDDLDKMIRTDLPRMKEMVANQMKDFGIQKKRGALDSELLFSADFNKNLQLFEAATTLLSRTPTKGVYELDLKEAMQRMEEFRQKIDYINASVGRTKNLIGSENATVSSITVQTAYIKNIKASSRAISEFGKQISNEIVVNAKVKFTNKDSAAKEIASAVREQLSKISISLGEGAFTPTIGKNPPKTTPKDGTSGEGDEKKISNLKKQVELTEEQKRVASEIDNIMSLKRKSVIDDVRNSKSYTLFSTSLDVIKDQGMEMGPKVLANKAIDDYISKLAQAREAFAKLQSDENVPASKAIAKAIENCDELKGRIESVKRSIENNSPNSVTLFSGMEKAAEQAEILAIKAKMLMESVYQQQIPAPAPQQAPTQPAQQQAVQQSESVTQAQNQEAASSQNASEALEKKKNAENEAAAASQNNAEASKNSADQTQKEIVLLGELQTKLKGLKADKNAASLALGVFNEGTKNFSTEKGSPIDTLEKDAVKLKEQMLNFLGSNGIMQQFGDSKELDRFIQKLDTLILKIREFYDNLPNQGKLNKMGQKEIAQLNRQFFNPETRNLVRDAFSEGSLIPSAIAAIQEYLDKVRKARIESDEAASKIQAVLTKIGQYRTEESATKKGPLRTAINKEAKDALEAIKSRSADLRPEVEKLMESFASMKGAKGLDELEKRLISISNTYQEFLQKAASSNVKRSEGGWIFGAGTSKSDSIMAQLSNGEFVVKASMAKEFGSLLEMINDGKLKSLKDVFSNIELKIDKKAIEKQLEGIQLNNARLSQSSIDAIKSQLSALQISGAGGMQVFQPQPRKSIADIMGPGAANNNAINSVRDAGGSSGDGTKKQTEDIKKHTTAVTENTKALDDNARKIVEKARSAALATIIGDNAHTSYTLKKGKTIDQVVDAHKKSIMDEIASLSSYNLGKNGGEVIRGRISQLHTMLNDINSAGNDVSKLGKVLKAYDTDLFNLKFDSKMAKNYQKMYNQDEREYAKIEKQWIGRGIEDAATTARNRRQRELEEAFGAQYSEKLKTKPYEGFQAALLSNPAVMAMSSAYNSVISEATSKFDLLKASRETMAAKGLDTKFLDESIARWSDYIRVLQNANGDFFKMLQLYSQSKGAMKDFDKDIAMARNVDSRTTVEKKNEGKFSMLEEKAFYEERSRQESLMKLRQKAADDERAAQVRRAEESTKQYSKEWKQREKEAESARLTLKKEWEKYNSAYDTISNPKSYTSGGYTAVANNKDALATLDKLKEKLQEIEKLSGKALVDAINNAVKDGSLAALRNLAGRQYGSAINEAGVKVRQQSAEAAARRSYEVRSEAEQRRALNVYNSAYSKIEGEISALMQRRGGLEAQGKDASLITKRIEELQKMRDAVDSKLMRNAEGEILSSRGVLISSAKELNSQLKERREETKRQITLQDELNKKGRSTVSEDGRSIQKEIDWVQKLTTELARLQAMRDKVSARQEGGKLVGVDAEKGIASLDKIIADIDKIVKAKDMLSAKSILSGEELKRTKIEIGALFSAGSTRESNEKSITSQDARITRLNRELEELARKRDALYGAGTKLGDFIDFSKADGEINRIKARIEELKKLPSEVRGAEIQKAFQTGELSLKAYTNRQQEAIVAAKELYKAQNGTSPSSSSRSAETEANKLKTQEDRLTNLISKIEELRRHRDELYKSGKIGDTIINFDKADTELRRLEAEIARLRSLSDSEKAKAISTAFSTGTLSLGKYTHMQGEAVHAARETEKANKKAASEAKEASNEARRAAEDMRKQEQAAQRLRSVITEVSNAIERLKISNKEGSNDQRIQQLEALLSKLYALSGLTSKEAKSYSKLVGELSGDAIGKAFNRGHEAQGRFNSQTMQTLASIFSLDQQFSMLAMTIQNTFSVLALQQFTDNIIKIGGELERQQLAMNSIFGDERKASAIYRDVADLSMKSPFTVQDLVTNTKQLSAFGVEYDNLYDTVKRLSDIAAAVGVDFSRIGYEYGQMESMGYLDARHLRMFSMSGIPLIQELVKKYSEERGMSVGAEEVRKMISKREVGADVVKEILRDMTNEGGRFFNMQEVMAESLASKKMNLGNQLNLMYGELALSGLGDFLKDVIQGMTDLAKEWKAIGTTALTFTAVIGAAKIGMSAFALATNSAAKAQVEAYLASAGFTEAQIAQLGANEALAASDYERIISSGALSKSQAASLIVTSSLTKAEKAQMLTKVGLSEINVAYAMSLERSSASMIRMRLAAARLNDALEKNAWIIAAVAAAALISRIISMREAVNKLKNEMLDLETKTNSSILTMTEDLDVLINKLDSESISQKEREKVIEQIQNKYGEYFSNLDKEADKYTAIKNAADSAKDAIKAKLMMQLQEDKIEAINSNSEERLTKGRKRTRELLVEELSRIGSNASVDTILQEIELGLIGGKSIEDIEKDVRSMLKNQFFTISNLNNTSKFGKDSISGLYDLSAIYSGRKKVYDDIRKATGHDRYKNVIDEVSAYYNRLIGEAKNANSKLKIEQNKQSAILKILTANGKVQVGSQLYDGFGLSDSDANEYISKYKSSAQSIGDDLKIFWRNLSRDIFETGNKVVKKEGRDFDVTSAVVSDLKLKSDEADSSAYFKRLAETRKKAKKAKEEHEKTIDATKSSKHNPDDTILRQYSIEEKEIELIDEYERRMGVKLDDYLSESEKKKKDEKAWLKDIRDKFDLFKKVQDVYKNGISAGNGDISSWNDALNSDAFGSLVKEGLVSEGSSRKDFELAAVKYKKQIADAFNMDDDDAKNLKEQIDQWIHQLGLEDAAKTAEREFKSFTSSLEDISREWDRFKELISEGIPRSEAIKMSFKVAGDVGEATSEFEYLLGMISKNLSLEGVTFGIDWRSLRNLDENEMADALYGDSKSMGLDMNSTDKAVLEENTRKYEERKLNVKETLELVKQLYSEEGKLKDELKSAVNDAIKSQGKVVQYALERNAVEQKYVELVRLSNSEEEKKYLTLKKEADLLALTVKELKENPMNQLAMNNLGILSGKALSDLKKKFADLFNGGIENGVTADNDSMKELLDNIKKIREAEIEGSFFGSVTASLEEANADAKELNYALLDLLAAENNLEVAKMVGNKDDIENANDEVTSARDRVASAEAKAANSTDNLVKSLNAMVQKVGQLGSVISNIGSKFKDEWGGIISSLGSSISAIPDIAQNIAKGGMSAVSGYASAVLSIFDLSSTLSDAIENRSNRMYDDAADRQKELNAAAAAARAYADAVLEVQQSERNWFASTKFMNTKDLGEKYALAMKHYNEAASEAQEKYQNKQHGGWGNYLLAGLTTATIVGLASITGGAAMALAPEALAMLVGESVAIGSTAVAIGTAAGAIGAGIAAGAEAIYDSMTYAEGKVAAINNLVIETRKKSNGFWGTGWGGHDQETQGLQQWLDDAKKIQDAYASMRAGKMGEKAYEDFVDSFGRGSGLKKAFAESAYLNDLFDMTLIDESHRVNVELAEAILADETMGSKLQGETKETLEMLVKYGKEMREVEDQLKQIVSDLYSPLVDNMTEAIWEWFDNGADALIKFQDLATNTFRNIANEIMKTALLQHVFKPFEDELLALQTEYSGGNMSEEQYWEKAMEISGRAMDAMESSIPYYEQMLENMEEVAQKNDYTLHTNNNSGTSTSLKGMTEDTADLIAAYLNGIRGDVNVQLAAVEWIAYTKMDEVIEAIGYRSGEAPMLGSVRSAIDYNDELMLDTQNGILEQIGITNESLNAMVYSQMPQLSAIAESQLTQLEMQTEYLRQIRESNQSMQDDLAQVRSDLHSVIDVYGNNRLNV